MKKLTILLLFLTIQQLRADIHIDYFYVDQVIFPDTTRITLIPSGLIQGEAYSIEMSTDSCNSWISVRVFIAQGETDYSTFNYAIPGNPSCAFFRIKHISP